LVQNWDISDLALAKVEKVTIEVTYSQVIFTALHFLSTFVMNPAVFIPGKPFQLSVM
jgi:hypothetical protein